MTDSRRSGRKKLLSGSVLLVAFGLFGGILASIGFDAAMDYSNRMELCTSCHSLQIPYEEYKQSRHYKNASGVQATCADCHVSQAFWPKLHAKVLAAKDVYHEIVGTIDTPEKFEAHRWTMANRVWDRMRANDSRECRSCHDFDNMDLSAQDRSARNRHSAARDRGQTCIDCHQGIAHERPSRPRASE